MKKKLKIELISYDSSDSIPSWMQLQIMKLSDNSSSDYANYLRKSRLSQTVKLTTWEDFIKSPYSYLVLYKKASSKYVEGEIIGYLKYHKDDTKISYPKNSTTICNLFIKPEYRNCGYAKKLVRYLYDYRKGSYFFIYVYEQNKIAQSFWKSVGFTEKIFSQYFLDWNED